VTAFEPGAFLVRPVDPDDLARWRPLWDGYNAFYGRAGATALPEVVTRITWGRLLDPLEPVHALIAEAGAELVGLAHYLFHRSTILIEPTCYLQDLFTAPAWRGRGVGRALIEAVRARGRAAGAAWLYWHTQTANATARRLYDGIAGPAEFVVYRMPL
jgi:GNAT superfamily N-acetyltransferase